MKKKTPRKATPLPTQKQPKPWERPPLALRGDATAEATFVAVGKALTAWEEFEHTLSYLFSAIVTGELEAIPARRAYGAVVTFRGRIEMVRAAAEALLFMVPTDPKWARMQERVRSGVLGSPGNAQNVPRRLGLLTRAEEFGSRRNEIAHGIVRQLWKAGMTPIGRLALGQSDRHSWGFAVIPPTYATNRNTLVQSMLASGNIGHQYDYRYTSMEIDAFAREFGDLRSETNDLAILAMSVAKNRGALEFPQSRPEPPKGR